MPKNHKSLLCVSLVTFNDRMVLFVAAVAKVEIEISDVISASRIDIFEALLEFFVAKAMKSGEIIGVFKAVFFFAGRDVVTVVVCSAAFVNFWITSEIIVGVCCVAWSAPD